MASWMKMAGRGDPLGALRRSPAVRAAAKYTGYVLLGAAMGAGKLFSVLSPLHFALAASRSRRDAV